MLLRFASWMVAVCAWSSATEDTERIDEVQQPMLWRIEGEKPSYLLGTIHIPDERVTNLPEVTKNVLDSCDAFYAELAMDDFAAHAEAMVMMTRQNDKTLKEVLPAATYAKLKEYLKLKNYPIASLAKHEVWAVDMTLQMIDVLKMMASAQPLDLALYMKAKAKGKEVGGIETFQEQLETISSGTEEEQIRRLDASLDQLLKAEDEGTTMLEKMTRVYLRGDAEEIMEMMTAEIDTEDPAIQKQLELMLDVRNVRMANRAAAKMKAEPGKSFVFAFGAAHMPGEVGVVALLRRQGFTVEQLDIDGNVLAKPREKAAAAAGG